MHDSLNYNILQTKNKYVSSILSTECSQAYLRYQIVNQFHLKIRLSYEIAFVHVVRNLFNCLK